VIPGFEGSQAIVGRGGDGQFFYRHLEGAAFTLTEAFASVTAGERVKLGRSPEHALWKRRLLLQTGRFPTPRVPLPPVSCELTESRRRVLEGVRLALCVRRLTDTDELDVPFSYRFGARWCGLRFDQVVSAINWLLKQQLLVRCGQLEGNGGYVGASVYRLAGLP
jgi:hypothetical protein